MHKPTWILLCALAVGCTATHERPMNKSEKTIVSDKVAMLVADNDGRLDTRDHDDVICDRIRTTGTHMVTRVCYTRAEKEALDKANQDKVRERWGKISCLDQSSLGCKGDLDETLGIGVYPPSEPNG